MWLWWNSIEALSKLNSYMQFTMVILGFFTALAGYFSYKTANRISELQEAKDAAVLLRLEASELMSQKQKKQIEHLKTAPIDTIRLRGSIDGGNAKGE